jgi:ATP-dependent DNA helicase RecG
LAFAGELESDRVERKRAWQVDAPEKARQAVCAFANDLPNHGKPGILFIGANDDGTASDLPVTDRLLQTLSDMKTDGKIVPPPTLTVQQRLLKGSPMAIVTVWPADAPPVSYEGRTWIRIGPRRGRASAQDERTRNEKRRFRDLHFEAHPISACLRLTCSHCKVCAIWAPPFADGGPTGPSGSTTGRLQVLICRPVP